MSGLPASPRVAQYRADAATALRQAKAFREHARTSKFPRIDRAIMRGFAQAWRKYTRLAQSW